MNYHAYKMARDAAWKVLIQCRISSLPVSLSEICRHYNWVLADYIDGAQSIDLLGLSDLKKATDGFCTMTQHHTYIFYDSSLPLARQRFTVAHEIGHLILGHVCPGTTTSHIGVERDAETMANQFAARLLAPAAVLHEVGAMTAEEIQHLCRISAQAAEYRAARMRELERRGRYYTSPLERQLVRQFESYIAVMRRSG